MKNNENKLSMDTLASLCKRRGFIFQSSEIYGGINGFWDYGPLGCELKRNVRETWWKNIVQNRENVVGLDASIIMHPKVWEASGHVGGFQDPMQTCQICKKHLRADQVWEGIKESAWFGSLVRAIEGVPDTNEVTFTGPSLLRWAIRDGKKLAPGLALVRNPQVTLSWLAEKANTTDTVNISCIDLIRHVATEQLAQTGLQTPCPHCGGPLTEPRQFNLMFETYVGAIKSEDHKTYLRPETAQGIFAQFGNVLATSRQKIPFGIAQIGKAFRNEINPRNYTFRSREFEQMELEFFVKPGTDQQWHEYWVEERMKWYQSIGLPAESLQKYVYKKEELAHYASACVDIMYNFPFGMQELEGIAARGDFDLSRHQQFSGKSMEYFNQETNEKFVPHVVEPSAGVDRIVLALLCNAYKEEWLGKDNQVLPAEPGKQPPEGFEARTVMRFHPKIAPVKVAVFPLLKNKPELVEKARGVFDTLQKWYPSFWDVAGAIGRRYRRQDEIGTPFCVTIDFDTLTNNTVTIRERDSMKQERIEISKLADKIHETLA
ncbi:MAG: glycine--tRNA ligase [Kiritimatiellae bacterium]|nr:glycine--tRNA ligase [Kiritimatiellia bacterium]MDD5520645.1 glycine--tRNA ligase [Kiritimatiellia bacterium]